MLLFTDSFDHYVTNDILLKYSSQGGTSSQSIASGAGRRGTSSWQPTSSGRSIGRTVTAGATKIIGFSLKVGTLPASTATICSMMEGATEHINLRIGTAGELIVARGTTALGTSAAGIIAGGATNYIELKGKVDNTTGTTEVRVNGSAIGALTLTGQDTQNAGTATCNNVELRGFASSTLDYDDFYICDDAGTRNNTFLGDVRVDAYLPNGNGNSSGMTGSDGNSTDNYLLVDESAQDGDTTYNEHATVSTKDTYAFANMSHTPLSIFGVQISACAKKDDAGARSVAIVTRSGGTDYDGTTETLSTAYLYYRQLHESNPNAGSPNDWTSTSVNAAEFGFKVAA